jgi:hypothetical protein
MMDSPGDKSTMSKLPSFNGKKADYNKWLMKMRVYAMINGFGTAITSTKDPDLPATETSNIDEATADGKKQKKAIKANFLAVAALASSFEADEDILMVAKSIDSDWPFGRAWIIMGLLEKSYKRTDMMAKARL